MTDKEKNVRFMVKKEETLNHNYELYSNPDAVQTHYADGIVSFSFGPAVSRLEFFVTDEFKQEAGALPFEGRKVAFRVVVPSLPLLESLLSISDQMKGNAEALIKTFDLQKEAVRNLLKSETT